MRLNILKLFELMYLGKNSKVRTPSPLCTHSVQKVWTSLLIWNNSNLWYQKKNKLYKWNVVVAKSMYISIYTNEKQCLPPLLQTTHLNELPPIFKRKSWASLFYDFSKISTALINRWFHTMAPQSNFALTSPTHMQLS